MAVACRARLAARDPDSACCPGTESWEQTVRSHHSGVVPEDVWEGGTEVSGTPARTMIRSVELAFA